MPFNDKTQNRASNHYWGEQKQASPSDVVGEVDKAISFHKNRGDSDMVSKLQSQRSDYVKQYGGDK